jgi:hypothetical protein
MPPRGSDARHCEKRAALMSEAPSLTNSRTFSAQVVLTTYASVFLLENRELSQDPQ